MAATRHTDVPLPLRRLSRRNQRRAATLAMAVMGLGLLLLLSGAKVARQDPGWVGVVRNGGPLDDRSIRQILQPGQRVTWIGWFSQDPHNYPARHVTRIYRVGAPPAAAPADKTGQAADPAPTLSPAAMSVPTHDGVQVEIEGAVYLNFIGESRPDLLKRFDITLGTRRFDTPDGRKLYPWEGDAGFAALLETIFRPVVLNDLRREVGKYQCWQLVASCTLIRKTPGPIHSPDPNDNINTIQDHIKYSVERDVEKTFGVPYFVNIRFRISDVRLPPGVQAAVDDAQAKFAAISGARAEVAQARYQRKRNELLADAYTRSPELARIDAIKNAPKGSTVIVSPSNASPALLVGK